MGSGFLTTMVVVLTLLFAAALVLIWRLYTDNARRTDEALRMVETERARTAEQQAALRRYEVTFASISGRGELGEKVLVETARSLGLREEVHFTLQTDLAGGGSARPDMVLTVGGGRRVPVDAKASLAVWAEAMETDDPEERGEALRVHVRNLRSRASELAGKGYQRWADAIYGTIMFVPSDAALITALDTDPGLLSWMLDKRVFPCGPTGFAVLASAALFAATERTLAEDVEQARSQAVRAQRAASGAVEAVNLSSTHLQRFVSARRRELDALESFRSAVQPLAEAANTPGDLTDVRRDGDGVAGNATSTPEDN
ncbi:DNA recombination protein RmuC [Saccharopolyspora lacisalsi]|uniref:DNA recombination protein RmuC n=1 Tax=Halosaccharopolyspora lacisalsi TaxID=1000566 RepID=A0A839DLR4_9PSEU|nr:DNA recombination protein RmuC [Halosaccharopolyspora lacisalsi]MBA8822902.1 DNA recombination protein RmuC [Halosaccharopolyspora lacisalsi]